MLRFSFRRLHILAVSCMLPLVLWLSLSAFTQNAFAQTIPQQQPMVTPSSMETQISGREKIVQAALSQVGKHNEFGPCDQPWCAYFASWAWRQAGIDIHTGFSGDFYTYGRQHDTLHDGLSNPQPGDAILFGTGPQIGQSKHMGIIVQVLPNGEVISVEGNYSHKISRVGPYSPKARGAYAIVSPALCECKKCKCED